MRARTVETLARVAAIYRGAVAAGESPVDAVADRLRISQVAARDRIYRARRAGLLAAHSGVFDIGDGA